MAFFKKENFIEKSLLNRFICVSSKKFLRTSLLENTCERFPPQPPQVKTPGNLKALETYRNSFHTLASIGYIYRQDRSLRVEIEKIKKIFVVVGVKDKPEFSHHKVCNL